MPSRVPGISLLLQRLTEQLLFEKGAVMATTAAIRQYQGLDLPAPGTYALDPSHTTVEFVARHLMISKVRGRLTDVSGEIHVADVPEESSAEVAIAAASIQ